jgi:hypothetical protein
LRGALRFARQRWWLGPLIAAGLIGIFAEIRAQPAAPLVTPAAALAPTADDAQVLAADAALSAAMRTGDRSAARRLLSLEFSFVDDAGTQHGRKAVLAGLKGLAATAPSGVSERIYGGVAMVTGHRMSARGNTVFFLDIWAKQKRAWRALVMQDVVLGAVDPPRQHETIPLETLRGMAEMVGCDNPCHTIPYRVRSPDEQEIVTTVQAIAKATVAHDAASYATHMADEFVHYETGHPPVPKSERVARIERMKQNNVPEILTAIQSMRVWVYGDGAAIISAHGASDDTDPLLRIAGVWVHRNGQWQMAISVQTDVEPERASSQ